MWRSPEGSWLTPCLCPPFSHHACPAVWPSLCYLPRKDSTKPLENVGSWVERDVLTFPRDHLCSGPFLNLGQSLMFPFYVWNLMHWRKIGGISSLKKISRVDLQWDFWKLYCTVYLDECRSSLIKICVNCLHFLFCVWSLSTPASKNRCCHSWGFEMTETIRILKNSWTWL